MNVFVAVSLALVTSLRGGAANIITRKGSSDFIEGPARRRLSLSRPRTPFDDTQSAASPNLSLTLSAFGRKGPNLKIADIWLSDGTRLFDYRLSLTSISFRFISRPTISFFPSGEQGKKLRGVRYRNTHSTQTNIFARKRVLFFHYRSDELAARAKNRIPYHLSSVVVAQRTL